MPAIPVIRVYTVETSCHIHTIHLTYDCLHHSLFEGSGVFSPHYFKGHDIAAIAYCLLDSMMRMKGFAICICRARQQEREDSFSSSSRSSSATSNTTTSSTGTTAATATRRLLFPTPALLQLHHRFRASEVGRGLPASEILKICLNLEFPAQKKKKK